MCRFVAFANSGWGELKCFISFNERENNRTVVTGKFLKAAYRFFNNHIHSLFFFLLLKCLFDFTKSDFYIMSDSMCELRTESPHTSLAMSLLWRPGSLRHSVRENHAGSNNSVTSALCSQRPRCCCRCCRYLLLFRKTKNKKETQQWRHHTDKHDQYRPGMLSFTFLFLTLRIFTTKTASTHVRQATVSLYVI